jgi:hypothetical protein
MRVFVGFVSKIDPRISRGIGQVVTVRRHIGTVGRQVRDIGSVVNTATGGRLRTGGFPAYFRGLEPAYFLFVPISLLHLKIPSVHDISKSFRGIFLWHMYMPRKRPRDVQSTFYRSSHVRGNVVLCFRMFPLMKSLEHLFFFQKFEHPSRHPSRRSS